MNHSPGLEGLKNILFYVLYDLREDSSIANIHLPRPDEAGPVLLLINQEEYIPIWGELNEMNENEGFEWMTSLIYRPMGTHTASDLLEDTPYILISHMDLVKGDPEGFFDKLITMRKWVPN